jgi:hypothetical protein
MYLEEAGCLGVDSSQVIQDRFQWRALVKTVMNCQV